VVNIPLLKRIAKTQKQVIMSTGMASVRELEEACQTLKDGGSQEIILLHCISAYPAKYEELNLRKIEDLRKRFNCVVGFSDHTVTIDAPAMAVYMGAKVIEKHITFRRDEGGPDASFSLEPKEFRALVQRVRKIEKKGLEKLSADEFPNLEKSLGSSQYETEGQTKTARPSIWASQNIKENEVITPDNIKVARPGIGISPKFYEQIIGKKVNQVIGKGTPFSMNFIKE
jgi:sialic acid synthase SpsE